MKSFLALLVVGAAVVGSARPVRAEVKTDIEYAKAGDVSLTLDASVPDGPGPFRTAILVHGGGFTGGTKTDFIKPIFEPLTKAGFTWFSINYRLAPANKYPDCVEDVENAIRWVKAHAAEYKVDVNHIALIGESAGGYLVSIVGARPKPDTGVAAVVSFYGPHDLELQVQQKGLGNSLKSLFGVSTLDDQTKKILHDASPSTYITQGMTPYLLIHGTADEQVPYEQSVQFRAKMLAAHNRCELYTIPDGRHGMGSWDKNHPGYKDQMIAWLRRTMPVPTPRRRRN